MVGNDRGMPPAFLPHCWFQRAHPPVNSTVSSQRQGCCGSGLPCTAKGGCQGQALTLLRTGAKGQTSAERQGVPFSLEEHLPALKYVVFYSGEKEVLSMR